MLIRRAKPKPALRRRSKPPAFKGYTDEQGFQREGAPENWPFGMLKRSEILARKLRALLDRKEDEPALL